MYKYPPCEMPLWNVLTVDLLKLLLEKTRARELGWRRNHDFAFSLWAIKGDIVIQRHDRPWNPRKEGEASVSVIMPRFESDFVSVHWENDKEGLVICSPHSANALVEQRYARLLFDYAEPPEKEDIVSNRKVLQQVLDKIEALKESLNVLHI